LRAARREWSLLRDRLIQLEEFLSLVDAASSNPSVESMGLQVLPT
jgi:hypothetical protein